MNATERTYLNLQRAKLHLAEWMLNGNALDVAEALQMAGQTVRYEELKVLVTAIGRASDHHVAVLEAEAVHRGSRA